MRAQSVNAAQKKTPNARTARGGAGGFVIVEGILCDTSVMTEQNISQDKSQDKLRLLLGGKKSLTDEDLDYLYKELDAEVALPIIRRLARQTTPAANSLLEVVPAK